MKELMMENKKLIFMFFTLSCFIATGVCLIVNLAVNNQITWAYYPLLSILFGWLILSPLLLKKQKFIFFLCALTLFTLPYLNLLSKITPVTDWFIPIGLPSFISGIAALWIIFPLFIFSKINVLYKTSIAVFLFGGVVGTIVNYFVDIYINENPFRWYRYIDIFVFVVASAVIGIIGYIKSLQKPDSNK